MPNILIPNCLVHIPGLLSREYADLAMSQLMTECRGDFSEISGRGRSMARYGETYTYRGRPLKTYPWRPILLSLRNNAKEGLLEAGLPHVEFNAVVLNMYKDETCDLPLHADTRAIPQLGKEPTIACISLGSTRKFVVAEKKTGKTVSIDLQHGDFYVMHGVSQSQYLHGAPAGESFHSPRISATFRYHT